VKLVAKFAAGVVDTGGKFATGVVDTGGQPWAANISPKKIRNGPNGILRGLGETDSWKKPEAQKISWHCPFKSWELSIMRTESSCSESCREICQLVTHTRYNSYHFLLFCAHPPPSPNVAMNWNTDKKRGTG
jgi:hypothetical protein